MEVCGCGSWTRDGPAVGGVSLNAGTYTFYLALPDSAAMGIDALNLA